MVWPRWLYSRGLVFTAMLCSRPAVRWTGTSGVSIFVPGMDGTGSFAPAGGPQATGWTSPDIGIFIAMGCFAKWERYAQIPATIARTALQTSEGLKTYLFIAVALLSALRHEAK